MIDFLRTFWWRGVSFQIGVIVVGILLRLGHLLENRSFWQDEICLALSIVHRSFAQIWRNDLLFPDFAQAPLFFQLIVKSFVSVLGDNEIAIRLFPFFAGIDGVLLNIVFLRASRPKDKSNRLSQN